MERGPTARDRARRAVKREIENIAMELFQRDGFADTSADQISTAAGISTRTFYRYFATKEDVVIGDPEGLGGRLAELLAARPHHEQSMRAMTEAVGQLAEEIAQDPLARAITDLMLTTPSLRARRTEKQRVWAELCESELIARAAPGEPPTLVREVAFGSTMAALDAALQQWSVDQGRSDLPSVYRAAIELMRDRG